jgi:hypothetical protein
MTTAEAPATDAPIDGAAQPVSWLDRLQGAVEGLPGPAWAWYILGALVFGVVANLVAGLARGTLEGGIDATVTIGVLLTFYLLGLAHELDQVAERAFGRFQELLPAESRDALHRDLLSVPARRLLLVTLGTLTVSVVVNAAIGPDAVGDGNARLGAIRSAVGTMSIVILASFAYRTVHQLATVARIHARAITIDALDVQPLHAFSSLTSRTGIGLLLMVLYGLIVTLGLQGAVPAAFTGPLTWIPGVFILVLAVCSFVLPLLGMHGRLEDEVVRLRREADQRLSVVLTRLHEAVREGRLDDADALNKSISSVTQERDILRRISTWPWQPGTIRGFAAALSLPVLVWLVTRLLDRLLI